MTRSPKLHQFWLFIQYIDINYKNVEKYEFLNFVINNAEYLFF